MARIQADIAQCIARNEVAAQRWWAVVRSSARRCSIECALTVCLAEVVDEDISGVRSFEVDGGGMETTAGIEPEIYRLGSWLVSLRSWITCASG